MCLLIAATRFAYFTVGQTCAAGCPAVSLSEPVEDGLALLRVAEERRLEGIVSKRRHATNRSGECRDWRKVKALAWREANRERWRLFV
jgi:hypothetical protein